MKKASLDLESLNFFASVVQSTSFARAASIHKIPRPTLTRKIQQLEAHLGVQLLVRTTRSVRTTELGQEFYHRVLAVLSATSAAEALVDNTKREPQGLLRVTAGVEYGMAVISPLLSKFSNEFPKVRVELDLTGRQVDLVREGFDVAVRIGPLADSSLFSRKLGSLSYGLYASSDYLKKAKKIKSPEDLQHHPSLTFTRGAGKENWNLRSQDQEVQVRTHSRLSANNFLVLKNAAEDGLGIVHMPKFLATESVASKRLVQVLPNWSSAPIEVHALFPEQRHLSPKVREFIDFMLSATRRSE